MAQIDLAIAMLPYHLISRINNIPCFINLHIWQIKALIIINISKCHFTNHFHNLFNTLINTPTNNLTTNNLTNNPINKDFNNPFHNHINNLINNFHNNNYK